MAIARVNLVNTGQVFDTSVALPAFTTTAGNAIIGAFEGTFNTPEIQSITDDAGNTYAWSTVFHSVNGDFPATLQVFWAFDIAAQASNVATVTWNEGVQYAEVVAGEYTDIVAIDGSVQFVDEDPAGTTHSINLSANSVADALIVGFARGDGSAATDYSSPLPTGTTIIWDGSNGCMTEFVVSTSAARTWGVTANTTNTSRGSAAVYFTAAAGGGAETPAPQSGLAFTGGMGMGLRRPPPPSRRSIVDMGARLAGSGQFARTQSGLIVPRRLAA